MVNKINWVSIQIILDRLLSHPLLQDVTLESVVQYAVDFIGEVGLPNAYNNKTTVIDIDGHKGLLPNDIVYVEMVKNMSTDECIRESSDVFHNFPNTRRYSDDTYKIQGKIIVTSFANGKIMINYKSIPVDEDGYPMIPDNPIFLQALELYIKEKYFTVLFDLGKISQVVFNNLQQQKCWKMMQLNSEFTIPSISEMEGLKNMWCSLIPNMSHFKNGFKNLGDVEYIKSH